MDGFLIILMGLTVWIAIRSACAQDGKSADRKPLIAVLDLQVTGGILRSEAQALSDRLRGEMQATKKFELIERAQMEALLKEQEFSLSDFSEQTAAKAGKLLSAEQVVIGTIGKVGRTYTVDVRFIDVETGKVLNSSQQDYDGPTEGLTQVMRNVARTFAGLPPMKINIASNTKWYIMSGAILAGGGAAIFLMQKNKKSGIPSFSGPPSLP